MFTEVHRETTVQPPEIRGDPSVPATARSWLTAACRVAGRERN